MMESKVHQELTRIVRFGKSHSHPEVLLIFSSRSAAKEKPGTVAFLA